MPDENEIEGRGRNVIEKPVGCWGGRKRPLAVQTAGGKKGEHIL